MSRPEQKRLRKEYCKLNSSSFVGKLKKVFARSESADRSSVAVVNEEQQHVIPLERITLCKELGHGEFGSVWQASWKSSLGSNDKTQVAVKCVSVDKLLASSSSFLQEAAIMTRMRHDNIVRLFGVVLDTKKVMMVSELASCGSLLECLHNTALRDSFPVHILCDYAEQIALGMSYLESQRLIHRDLAARNVLVFSPRKIKISDFGLSRSLGVGEDYYRSEFTPLLRLPIAWCAPECINFLKFTSKSDVYAYGVTLWEMFMYGEMPWKGLTGAQILDTVDCRRQMLKKPSACPEDIYELMKETWTHAYDERPTFAEIMEKFPERRAQTVRAICDCRDSAFDHLHFQKDDLIVVIDRKPSAYPDGYYWFGSLRNGKLGLFRPSDTVAHLGSEVPTNNTPSLSLDASALDKRKKVSDKKDKRKCKEDDRERRKALISEPVGEVRHTCHVGIDGTAFGLLQVCLPLNIDLREDPARSGVSPTSTMSLRDEFLLSHEATQLRDAVSSSHRNLSRPAVPSKCVRPSASMTSGSLFDEKLSEELTSLRMERSRGSLTPTAPPLTASAENSLKAAGGAKFSIARNLENDGGYERFGRSGTNPPPESNLYSPSKTGSIKYRGPVVEMPTSRTKVATPSTTSSLVSTDEYPYKLPSRNSVNRLNSPAVKSEGSYARPEIKTTAGGEHNTSSNKEGDIRHRFGKDEHGARMQSQETSGDRRSDSLSAHQPQKNEVWTPEAQEAYKLLVECGTSLTQTSNSSPTPSNLSQRSTLERKETSLKAASNSRPSVSPVPPRPTTPPHVFDGDASNVEAETPTSYINQKRVHIIETKIIDGPARDMSPIQDQPCPAFTTPMAMQRSGVENSSLSSRAQKAKQFPLIDEQLAGYDNLNGYGAGARLPPPVPPKPKVRSPSSSPSCEKETVVAPSTTRSSLFKPKNVEEIIKF